MQNWKKPTHKWTVASLVVGALLACLTFSANAASVTVTDVTDWTTMPNETPNEVVNIHTFIAPTSTFYNGGAYAGINDLSVNNGTSTTVYDGFCIDPFHFSASGPVTGYQEVPLDGAPKAPGTLNAYTANEIDELWTEYFSPTMSAPNAAGLQVAIWELVSSNAVASGALLPADATTFSGDTYSAAADLASLATYNDGTPDSLTALTGNGQDYVIYIPGNNQNHNVPDSGMTISLLLLSLGALILARPMFVREPALSSVRQS